MEHRVTATESYLIDAHESPPRSGTSVLALTIGGKLCETVWKSDSLLYFDAWASFPKIPKSVRDRQMARYVKEIV